jgi:protein SMG5
VASCLLRNYPNCQTKQKSIIFDFSTPSKFKSLSFLFLFDLKNLKSNIEIETMYRLHLTSAYGFYNQLILKLQTEFSSLIQLNSFLDLPIVEKSQPSTNYENADLLREVLMRIIHKLLLCLGDLARYQIEYDPNASPKLAQKYYQMSLILLPNSGMPLNQLGTLYDMENYGCDATYY